MSKLRANIGETMYSIKRWRGINENPDGDTNLKDGEAAKMRNFRISDGGALRKRPGTKAVAGLASEYRLGEGSEKIFKTEIGESTARIEGYGGVAINSVGQIIGEGESKILSYENAADIGNFYFNNSNTFTRFEGVDRVEGATIGLVGTEPPTESGVAFGNNANGAYDIKIGMNESNVYLYVYDEAPDFGKDGWQPDGGYSVDISQSPFLLIGKYVVTPAAGALSTLIPYRGTGDVFGNIVKNNSGNYAYITNVINEVTSEGIVWSASYEVRKPIEYKWRGTPLYAIRSAIESPEVKAIWSGYVGDKEYIVAACTGHLWRLNKLENGQWEKGAIGQILTNKNVCIFGFDGKLYVLDSQSYYCWDGETFGEVEGYIPTIGVATSPAGETTLLERVNLLTNKRRQLFSADGSSTVYQLAENNLLEVNSVYIDGELAEGYDLSLSAGTITFKSAPKKGSDNVEVIYSVYGLYENRHKVAQMRYAEFYNGVNDSRVFLYGDGSNVCLYSEPLYTTGRASAEYFPDLNEIGVGDSNTPLTSLIRHYDRLLAFKSGGGAYSIYYDSITLADGSLTAGFYCNSVNRSIGNDALGQACLVENQPRTIDGKSIYEWKSAGGGYMTNDQRNAERISDKVRASLESFAPDKCTMFYDKYAHEFYCVYDGTAIVQNTANEAWYIYTAFPALCMINYRDKLYYGSPEGELVEVGEEYTADGTSPIDCYWESGSLSFGRDWMEKYSPEIWVGLNQEPNAEIEVGIMTDKDELIKETVSLESDREMPTMVRKRLKGRKFTFYKLIFATNSNKTTATVAAVDIKAKYNIPVK